LNLQIIINKSILGMTRLVLTTTGPLQKLIDHPGATHEFCNTQALKILQHDGFSRCATFFLQYAKELNSGVYWADQGWKNVSHFFKPASTKGLWRFPGATEEFEQHLSQAMKTMRQGNLRKAVFFLGAAAHLAQDLCVPHHALGKMFAGHQQYETWVQQHYDQYAVNSHGIYWEGEPVAILPANAAVSADLFKWVETDTSERWYHKATEILLPLAQCTTAGLLQWFYGNLSELT
jgi:phospholipase C